MIPFLFSRNSQNMATFQRCHHQEQERVSAQGVLIGGHKSAPKEAGSSEVHSSKTFFENAPENVVGFYIPPKAANLNELLQYTAVEHLLAHRGQLVTLNDTNTIEESMKILRDGEVTGAPVYDVGGQFMGMVDMKDMVAYLAAQISATPDLNFEECFLHQMVGNVVEISKQNPTPVVPPGTSIKRVLNILSQGQSYRVGVIDSETKTIINIVAQSSLIKFFARNISLLPEFLRAHPVSNFMEKLFKVCNVPSDETTRTALRVLYSENISGVAIVDSVTGTVIDTFSCTDLQGTANDRFKYFDQPVIDFLAMARRTKALKPPICCSPHDTLEDAILKLAATGVHRLWVIHDDKTYGGLVNISHLLDYLRRSLQIEDE